MVGRITSEKTDKQRDYILFLEQVLDICITFKEKLDSGYKKIFFRTNSSEHGWHSINEEGWGNHLSCCIYDAIASDQRYLEISQSKEEPKLDIVRIKADFDVSPIEIPDTNEEVLSGRVRQVLDKLKNGFVDDKVISRLDRVSSAFLASRDQILKKKSVFHLENYEIGNYLEAYYDFLTSCVIYYNSFNQSKDRDWLIDILLHVDSKCDEENGVYQLSFWSPVVLNKLQKINYGVESFFEQITKEQAMKSKMMQYIDRHTLLTKAQCILRWYTPGEKKELEHAAIAPYVEDKAKNLTFQIIARNLKFYNSYEGIGELRLGEKIIYEYRMLNESEKVPSRYCVAIMGDLHTTPLKELYYYVTQKIEKEFGRKPLLDFNIYTKNKVDKSGLEKIHIICKGSPDQVLLNRNELSQVIDTNNIVFILDCIELYNSPSVMEGEEFDFIRRKYAFSSYDEYNTGFRRNADICDHNALEELYDVLTGEQCFKKFGRIEKRANEPLLEFCERKQKERGKESAIYIYVSDLKAFEKIYNDDQYYIRTERYNQKEIGIIRYSSEEVTKLEIKGNDEMLVFNMWQFIKNVAIDERDTFTSMWASEECDYKALDKIHIGIDYADWPNLLTVHYFSEYEQYEQMAVKFIEEVLLPILNNRSRDMFNTYIRKAMNSFFYGAAKSVDDMLFVHLFQDKENLLGQVVPARKNNQKKVERNINRHFKYSSKRFYDMIMKNYDISSNSYIGQIKTSQIIQKNESTDARIVKKDIYNNVIEACRNLSYENGYLVQNCKREL